MPYQFFFSYARASSDSYLRQFFADLEKAVRDKLGAREGPVGFFDQQELTHGDDWPDRLLDALQTSKTFVAVYSPAYFNSEFCGQEWQVFHLRQRLYVEQRRAAGDADPRPPAGLKPILWIPLREPLDGEVGVVQYKRGDPAAIQNTKGLQYVRRLVNHYQLEYRTFVDELALEILNAADQHTLPPLDRVPPFGSIVAPFPKLPTIGDVREARGPVGGPASVRFVFVAGRPDHFAQGGRTGTDAYREVGGRDWKPFFPDRLRAIGPLAQSVASSEDLNLFSEELPFDNQLITRIRDAEKDRRLVVVLADMFSVDLPAFRDVLREFDKQNFENCSVLIPRNDRDPDAGQLGPVAAEALGRILYFRTRLNNRVYYRDGIRSEDDLRTQLRDVLTVLRAEIINRMAPAAPVPPGGSKPTISGPGGGNGSRMPAEPVAGGGSGG